ncbi:hypothetical protein F4680DRAFT_451174 [Xylaria scruposa]|nr:hypothetical protein F4680DRAFT_451174 [Xylaria scruposa]
MHTHGELCVGPDRGTRAFGYAECLADFKADLSLLPSGVDATTDIVEIGPHPALRRPIKDNLSFISSSWMESKSVIRYHSSLERPKSALQTVVSLVGTLFCHGHPVSVSAVNKQVKGGLPPLVDCPPYPFDHKTMPWLADHAISNSVVCPGTGMAVIALEAVKQLLMTGSRSISGFLMKQGEFLAPITVGEALEDATETELHLRQMMLGRANIV